MSGSEHLVCLLRLSKGTLYLLLSFRTLATDEGFLRVVSEDMLARLLDAFVWHSLQGQSSCSCQLDTMGCWMKVC